MNKLPIVSRTGLEAPLTLFVELPTLGGLRTELTSWKHPSAVVTPYAPRADLSSSRFGPGAGRQSAATPDDRHKRHTTLHVATNAQFSKSCIFGSPAGCASVEARMIG